MAVTEQQAAVETAGVEAALAVRLAQEEMRPPLVPVLLDRVEAVPVEPGEDHQVV
jgi:hypothetical protein